MRGVNQLFSLRKAVQFSAMSLLALRRIGPRRLEALYGAGKLDRTGWSGRQPIAEAEWAEELRHATESWLDKVSPPVRGAVARAGLKVCVASSDVHEHGKNLIEHLLVRMDASVIDGGTSADADDLVAVALDNGCDLIAISTCNGIALRFASGVMAALRRAGVQIPVCIGGRLNQIPEDSNSGLPIDVSTELEELGVIPCDTPERLVAKLDAIAGAGLRREFSAPRVV